MCACVCVYDLGVRGEHGVNTACRCGMSGLLLVVLEYYS